MAKRKIKTDDKKEVKKQVRKKKEQQAAVIKQPALTPVEKLNKNQREFAQLFMQYGNSKKAGEIIWPEENERYYIHELNKPGVREYIRQITQSHNELIDADWLINRLAYESTNPDNPPRDRITALKVFADALTGKKSDDGKATGLLSSGNSLPKDDATRTAEQLLEECSIEELEKMVYEEEMKEAEVIDGQENA